MKIIERVIFKAKAINKMIDQITKIPIVEVNYGNMVNSIFQFSMYRNYKLLRYFSFKCLVLLTSFPSTKVL